MAHYFTGHWAHQQTGLHYNNVTHESILDPECADGSIHCELR